jgi:hypothetical protein
MVTQKSRELRGAIENLMNAKLVDILARQNQLGRLEVQRCVAAATEPIRKAERQLDNALYTAFSKTRAVPHRQKLQVTSRQNTDSRRPSFRRKMQGSCQS